MDAESDEKGKDINFTIGYVAKPGLLRLSDRKNYNQFDQSRY